MTLCSEKTLTETWRYEFGMSFALLVNNDDMCMCPKEQELEMIKNTSVKSLVVLILLLACSALMAGEVCGDPVCDEAMAIHGEEVGDSELMRIVGKGTNSHLPSAPDTLAVILWDESGSGKKSTQHSNMTGSGNVQKVSMSINGN